MSIHIYAYGSVCRGEVSKDSDIDLLAVVDGYDSRFDPNVYSIYSHSRIQQLWEEGNPYAWHLSLESRLLFSSDGGDYLKTLGDPKPYKNCLRDCEKFRRLFETSSASLKSSGGASNVFELSSAFLAVRNIATCYSLGMMSAPCFSRHCAKLLGSRSVPVPDNTYAILERCRILSTRGRGVLPTEPEIDSVIQHLDDVGLWMRGLVEEIQNG